MNTAPLPPGKLPVALLAELLGQEVLADPRVLIGPRIGEDSAVIDIGARLRSAKWGTILFTTDYLVY